MFKKFPSERDGINAYFKHLKVAGRCARLIFLWKLRPRWLAALVPNSLYNRVMAPTTETAEVVVNRFVKDKKLRALLSGGQLIDWNLKPNE